jgi:hypothetical protein
LQENDYEIGLLYSVEVVQWRIPINCNGFFAFWISANKFLLDYFTIKTAFQRFFKGICGMNVIRRVSFKSPMAIGTFEYELR